LIAVVVVILFVLAFLAATDARAHQATSIAGDPLGWNWPPSCCNSAATHPYGDCAIIDAKYVKERSDGYHVDIPIGGHPKLKTKGYSAVIPYKDVRDLPTGEYGICLATDGARRFCFFAGPKGF
jgi:hypothetical protein